MSEEQKISSLIICYGLCYSFSIYGIKIRISVFGERDNVWELSQNFSNEKIEIYTQLSKFKDALCYSKRIQFFSADASIALKKSFDFKNLKSSSYCQILISSLISPQVVDKNIDWSILESKIIIFGLESNFEKDFISKYIIFKK